MTRAEAIARQTELFGSGPDSQLPNICMALRAGVNGSADPWFPVHIKETLVMLQNSLKTWEPSEPRARQVDEAVRSLVSATMQEVHSYDWWKYEIDIREQADKLATLICPGGRRPPWYVATGMDSSPCREKLVLYVCDVEVARKTLVPHLTRGNIFNDRIAVEITECGPLGLLTV